MKSVSGTVSTETSTLLSRRLESETRGEVLFDDGSRGRYATDASIYQVMPVGVFVPRTAQDVAMAIDIARDLKVPIVPRGAGTSQCGQTVGAGLVIDNSKYRRAILDVDVENRTAKVEPGLVLDHLNAQLKRHGLWHPVDVSTSAQATLGGMAGNNSCGSRSIAYGNMVTMCWAQRRGCRMDRRRRLGPCRAWPAGRRGLQILCATWPQATATT